MTSDTIETLGNSTVQHGKYNDRVYLMKLDSADLPHLLTQLVALAERHRYSKIFAKVPASAEELFLEKDYTAEARIPRFYNLREDVLFFGKFLDPQRAREKKESLVLDVLSAAAGKRGRAGGRKPLPDPYQSRGAGPDDIQAMASVYSKVFATYPFPIHEPDYLLQTMQDNVAYFGIWYDGRLVALSSAEMDPAGSNAEMTDFATLPDFRGKGLATHLLAGMEKHLMENGITTAYTIARAYSYGMNITFARQGYNFSGTLTNNTNIFGGMESMNVWHKAVVPHNSTTAR